MRPSNQAVRAMPQTNQRNGGPVFNGAPFNVTKSSNDVEIETVGSNGLKPMVVSKKPSPQHAPTGVAVDVEQVPVVVHVARFTSKIMAGVNNAETKKIKKSLCADEPKMSGLGSSSSALGANEPRDRDDGDILGRHERGSLLPPPAAAAGVFQQHPLVVLLRLKK